MTVKTQVTNFLTVIQNSNYMVYCISCKKNFYKPWKGTFLGYLILISILGNYKTNL